MRMAVENLFVTPAVKLKSVNVHKHNYQYVSQFLFKYLFVSNTIWAKWFIFVIKL